VLLLAGVLSVLMRVIVFLFGPERLRAGSAYGAARVMG
jgi:hypothetical protein